MKYNVLKNSRASGEAPTASEVSAPGRRRPYREPSLTVHGDVRSLTLGPSPGIGESGLPLLLRANSRSMPPFPPR